MYVFICTCMFCTKDCTICKINFFKTIYIYLKSCLSEKYVFRFTLGTHKYAISMPHLAKQSVMVSIESGKLSIYHFTTLIVLCSEHEKEIQYTLIFQVNAFVIYSHLIFSLACTIFKIVV